jgi:type I restriction enzyme S subunit
MNDTLRNNKLEHDTNGSLPEGWREAALSDVSEIKVSNVDKKSNVGEIPVRLCNYLDVYKNQYITANLPFMEATAAPSEIAQFGVEVGDVMITKDSETPDDIGVSAVASWSEPRLVCGYHLALIKPDKSQVDPVFLAKQLRLPRIVAYFGRLACGSTRYGLSHSGIAKTPLTLPSPGHQAKIARILMNLDDLIEKTEALIAKYQAIKQGMMHDLFTRGVDEHGHLRPSYAEAPDFYKPSELGWIPKEWDLVTAKQLCHEITKGTTPSDVFIEDGPGRVPFIRVQNLSFDGTLLFDTDKAYMLSTVHDTALVRSRP